VNGDWDELKDKFCLAFFPMSRIGSLPRAMLEFEQPEKESIGSAWAWFSTLLHAGYRVPQLGVLKSRWKTTWSPHLRGKTTKER
jgi:hypothetical protein